MKILFIFLLAASLTSGIQYNGLRVKFGWTHALADKEYFYKLPRIITQAETDGWRRTERPPGPMAELRMYCSPGRSLCTLYSPSGFVAGIQLAFPVDELITTSFRPEQRFTKWSAPASDSEPAKEFWSITQYLVSEESLKAGAGPQVENDATLQDGGVWVNDLDGQLMRIPSTEAELNTTLFKKQNCIPNMGTHYYYNMTRETSCDNLLPWFALTMNGNLIGVGFQVIGKVTKPLKGNWFELLSNGGGAEMAIPIAPECFYKLLETNPVISLHIYYIDNPWDLTCRDGDSAKPAGVLNQLLLDGYRSVSTLWDLTKTVFTGK